MRSDENFSHDAHHEHLAPPSDSLEALCRKWRVRELSLFGSVLRDDFGPDSDVGVLVSFDEDAPWSLWDMIAMQDELAELFGRPVDLVEREGLRNPFRRRRMNTARSSTTESGAWPQFTYRNLIRLLEPLVPALDEEPLNGKETQ